MGTSAKLGEGFTTKTLEFKHFCQQTAPNFMDSHGNESVLKSGGLYQKENTESVQKLSLVLKEVATEILVSKLFDQDETGRSFFYVLDLIDQTHPIGMTGKFAQRCWVDRVFNKIAKGWRMFFVTALQGREYSGNPSLNEIARGSQVVYLSASQEKTVRFHPIAARGKCQKRKYNINITVLRSTSIEAIDGVRLPFYRFNKGRYWEARWKGIGFLAFQTTKRTGYPSEITGTLGIGMDPSGLPRTGNETLQFQIKGRDINIRVSIGSKDNVVEVGRTTYCSLNQKSNRFTVGKRWNKDQFTESSNISGNFKKVREPLHDIDQMIIELLQAWRMGQRRELTRNAITQEMMKVIEAVRVHTYSFNRKICCRDLTGRSENKRSELEGVALVATQPMIMMSGFNNNTSPLGVAWFLSPHNLMFISLFFLA
ncbi:uncharacterized protein PGTG_00132 [Puccinia graminis f. sp. tritici CRL 75-36-700-3]|uniref:Uncharacterized protein n=1 Tax=Puccinia graminis f. sp. tritici (strain CRL 75-36-700-3 / race SCCL) TaxID=418459 RepID=E3JR14_PUCGT|nr:uncharacterized protein PGTG_00132 [Puccinia graminis f. sp. tritici CRL 75-36-700-3]EFP74176.1 hypothetical protein PGTG_00132 [Puccinia graminis f. sp. tritici CRL 75-36-700-3]